MLLVVFDLVLGSGGMIVAVEMVVEDAGAYICRWVKVLLGMIVVHGTWPRDGCGNALGRTDAQRALAT